MNNRATRQHGGTRLALCLLLAWVSPTLAAQKTTRITGPQLLDMIRQGQFAQAETILKQQLDHPSPAKAKARARLLYLYGHVLQQQFRYGEAEPQLRAALQLEPTRVGWLEELAEGLLRQGRCKASIVELEKAWALDPQPRMRFNIAMCALNLGDLARAEKELRQLVAAGNEEPQTLFKLGALLADQGSNDEALPLLRRAVAGDPSNVEARFALGRAESRAGHHSAAAAAFREVRRAIPGHAGAAYNLGRTLARLGQSEESRKILLEFQELSKKDDLIENHLQYVQLNATNPQARVALAKLLLDVGRLSEAVEQLEAARRLDPQRAETHRLLAEGYLLLGRMREAQQADSFAAQLEP